jgi:hypothetical protein
MYNYDSNFKSFSKALSQDSTFVINVDCTSANDTLNQILEQFKNVFSGSYNVTYDENTLQYV